MDHKVSHMFEVCRACLLETKSKLSDSPESFKQRVWETVGFMRGYIAGLDQASEEAESEMIRFIHFAESLLAKR